MAERTTWAPVKRADTFTSRALFQELHAFVVGASAGASVRPSLAARLRALSREERRALVSRLRHGCSPLFAAARDGQLALVRFLLDECDADVEQRGEFVFSSDHSRHCATPLWCAAVTGRLAVVRYLCAHGADVDAASDSGSTPVRSACLMTHVDVVRYLVCEAGANIHLANHNGGTCLINAIQNRALCQLLLESGADVNAVDVQNKSALHYAIQEHREDSASLLVLHGANPHIVSRSGDDALQTACLRGDEVIFSLLCSKVAYSDARLANAHELIGATLVDEHHDIPAALSHWQRALEIRCRDNRHLTTSRKQQLAFNPAYLGEREFETMEDLNELRTDWDRVKIQSLLITERIIGRDHQDMSFRLMYRGAAYADALMYERCVSLWVYALRVRVQRDAVLSHEVCLSAHALARLLADVLLLQQRDASPPFRLPCRHSDVCDALDLLVDQLPGSQQLLQLQPRSQLQQTEFDLTLAFILRLVHVLALSSGSSAGEEHSAQWQWRRAVFRAVQTEPLTSAGHTLLHLAVRPHSLTTAQYSDAQTLVLPSVDVVRVLIQCGSNVNAEDKAGVTPLLLAAFNYSRHPTEMAVIVDALLSAGAHLDWCRIDTDQSPLSLLTHAGHHPQLNPLDHVTLRCLAARVVRKHVQISAVPALFRQFVLRH